MAYGDYGAFVYQDGKRREDKEDASTFENVAIGFTALGSDGYDWAGWLVNNMHHGIIGDGDIRVMCHKTALPRVFERIDGIVIEVDVETFVRNVYGKKWDFSFDYKEHHFKFVRKNSKRAEAEMIEPDGTYWRCEYGYEYGAGFEDD